MGSTSEDRKLVERLNALRARVPRVVAIEDDPEEDSLKRRYGLDAFDRLAKQPLPRFIDRLREGNSADEPRAKDLLFQLRFRLNQAYPERDESGAEVTYNESVRALFAEHDEIEADKRYVHRRFSVEVRTSGAFALARLRAAIRQMNPPPRGKRDDDAEQFLDDYVLHLVGDPRELVSLIHGGEVLGQKSESRINAAARDLVQRTYEELRERIGTALSLRALILRFKVRAEAYDRDALCEIAGDQTIVRKEDRLADRLAAYLFDQGLTPLTRPMISGLSPDIVAPDLYVEAKQYGDRAAARKNIREGAKQVWDTLGRLRGTAHDVREAYLVVFRRSGPGVVFEQDSVRAGGATLHAIVVDVAPGEESGSRQTEKPVTITAADLLPEPAAVGPTSQGVDAAASSL